jgi:hypothetical protein
MPHIQYFDRTGRALSKREAFEADGSTLRDGVHLRVPSHLADHAVRFTDLGSGNRPGWRTADSDLGRAARDAAARDHERRLNDSWKSKAQRDAEKLCPDCNGDGDIDGEDCETCLGTGEIDTDDADNGASPRVRPVTADAVANHQQNMARVYDQIASDLSQQWRRGK